MFDPTTLPAAELAILRERIAARVAEIDPASGCRLTAPVYDYPLIRIRGHLYRLPRVVYVIERGPIAAALVVDHECHNRDPHCSGGHGPRAAECRHRRCIEPSHFAAVSRGENVRRSPHTPAGRALALQRTA